MATAQEIITTALRELGVFAPGETLQPEDLSDGLSRLNQIIETWQTDERAYFSEVDSGFTLTIGKGQYAIGDATIEVASITRIGNIATVTTRTRHSFESGNMVTMAGAVQADYNITAPVAVTGPYSYTYVVANSPATPATTASEITAVNADFNTARPVEIIASFVRVLGRDYTLGSMTERYWNGISLKSQQTPHPVRLLYRPGFPFGQIILYPVPSEAGQLHIKTRNCLQPYTTYLEDQPMPPGYRRALELALAIDSAPEYREKVSQETLLGLTGIFQSLWALNTGIPKPSMDNTRNPAVNQATAAGG
jgi:hypothetical protein